MKATDLLNQRFGPIYVSVFSFKVTKGPQTLRHAPEAMSLCYTMRGRGAGGVRLLIFKKQLSCLSPISGRITPHISPKVHSSMSFMEETNMSELRYPNESRAYRDARDALFKEEQALVDKVKSVAEKRRSLPPGGQLKEDYVFQWANDGKVGESVKFSELFGDKNTLLLYSFMYGPNWDHPCPSCTSLVDGFDRTWYQVTQHAAFVAIAKAPADRINAWAKQRGWSQIALVSGSDSAYQADYKCQGDSDDMQLPMMHVFRKQDGKIYHFWGSELPMNHVDTVWAYWNLMDFTPEGRPDIPTPPQNFKSEFLEKNYLNKD
jgi:predicted dithiol-disulfide oxidoreductase (DUF899 family)